MIDFSICPDNPIRSGADKRGIATVVEWLNSVVALASGDDASGGAVKAALSSNKRLYVTAYQYTLANATFTCLNVMVDRRDYQPSRDGTDRRVLEGNRFTLPVSLALPVHHCPGRPGRSPG